MSARAALLIGSTRYQDPKLSRLTAPAGDVEALSGVLRTQGLGGFEVQPIIDGSTSDVMKAIGRFFKNRHPDDLLLFYFSGHGLLDEVRNLYFASTDTDTELLSSTAIPATFVRNEMDRCRATSQIFVLDCCHGGAFTAGAKGAPVGESIDSAINFTTEGKGRVVLTATTATQYAFEGEKLIGRPDRSVFTHYMIEGLQTGDADFDDDGRITVDELYRYVWRRIQAAAPNQSPTKWAYGQTGDIVLSRCVVARARPDLIDADVRQDLNDSRIYRRQGALSALKQIAAGPRPGAAAAALDLIRGMAVSDDSFAIRSEADAVLASLIPTKPPQPGVLPGEPQAGPIGRTDPTNEPSGPLVDPIPPATASSPPPQVSTIKLSAEPVVRPPPSPPAKAPAPTAAGSSAPRSSAAARRSVTLSEQALVPPARSVATSGSERSVPMPEPAQGPASPSLMSSVQQGGGSPASSALSTPSSVRSHPPEHSLSLPAEPVAPHRSIVIVAPPGAVAVAPSHVVATAPPSPNLDAGVPIGQEPSKLPPSSPLKTKFTRKQTVTLLAVAAVVGLGLGLLSNGSRHVSSAEEQPAALPNTDPKPSGTELAPSERSANPDPPPKEPTVPEKAAPEPKVDVTVGNAPVMGPAGAPVTIVEFSEFQCPFCSRVVPTLRELRSQYKGKLRIAFKQLPLPFHEHAQLAAEASLAAKAQGRFWEYHDKLFENQKELDRVSLEKYAEDLGLDMRKFRSALDSRKYKSAVERDAKEAAALGITGTPSFFINGTRVIGAQPIEKFTAVIDEKLEAER